jgi:chorismate dehydratase
MTLRVGHITYANCAPFFHYLPGTGFAGQIVPGVPAELNALLAAGQIDVSPSSSFEYARNWRDYLLLPGHSISACGPVRSVLLFSSRPLAELDGKTIALTGESATSVHLLKILLLEFLGHQFCACRIPETGTAEEVIDGGGAALLIGDKALQMARRPQSWRYRYDLGELWTRFTGFPFVFALWILRRDAAAAQPGAVAELLEQLTRSRRMAFSDLPLLASRSPERVWMPEVELVDYWRSMDYDLGENHLAGLRLYCKLCVKYGFLGEVPEIRFFHPEVVG